MPNLWDGRDSPVKSRCLIYGTGRVKMPNLRDGTEKVPNLRDGMPSRKLGMPAVRLARL